MIKKFGKPFDFQNLNRNLSWRKTLSAEQGKLAARAFVDQGPRLKICPICSANESSHFGQIYGFDFVECNDCTHLFISNQPSSADRSYVRRN
jgi:hypothetical protein